MEGREVSIFWYLLPEDHTGMCATMFQLGEGDIFQNVLVIVSLLGGIQETQVCVTL